MRFLKGLRAYLRVMRRARRNRTDVMRWLVRRPALLLAINTYEGALLASNRVEPRLKLLAGTKAASMTGCPF